MNSLFKNCIKPVKWIGQRGIIFYLLILLLFHTVIDFDKTMSRARLLVLNRLRPETFYYITDFIGLHPEYGKIELEEYAFYYKAVVEYMPHRADALGLLGYCSYYLGQLNESISSYQRAIGINPDFFWFHYNLGVIYFKEGRYKEALESFKKALATKPQQAFEFIRFSRRIYLPIIQKILPCGPVAKINNVFSQRNP